MSKIAFIYPGQGAQKAGMGKDPTFMKTVRLQDTYLTRQVRNLIWI